MDSEEDSWTNYSPDSLSVLIRYRDMVVNHVIRSIRAECMPQTSRQSLWDKDNTILLNKYEIREMRATAEPQFGLYVSVGGVYCKWRC